MASGEAKALIEQGALTAVSRALAEGRVTATELTEAALARIEALNDRLNAFLGLDPDASLREAAASDSRRAEGRSLGPLDGAPYALKDLIDASGWPTTGGGKVLPTGPKARDAGVAARLRAAGGVLIGKTNLHELAYGVTSQNPHFGPVRNPWDETRSPGGSSGGSAAAVAAGMAPLAIGTDTGCSIRHPAHCCGIVGFKPSHGRVSAAGVLPLVRQMDHVGPLTRGVADAALAMDALSGFDGADPFAVPFEEPMLAMQAVEASLSDANAPSPRFGLLRGEGFERGDVETLALVQTAIVAVAEALRAELVDFEPLGLRALWRATATLFAGDPCAVHAGALHRSPQLFGADVRAKLEHGGRVRAASLAAAQEEVRRFRRAMAQSQSSQGLDVLLAPTCGAPAPRITMQPDAAGRLTAAEDDPWADYATVNCTPFNATGQPAISIPCGVTKAGLPVGLMLVGPYGEDAALLALAARAERALAEAGVWRGQRPPL